MPREKVVGIIGGMGPEATVDFMRRVIAKTPAQDDNDHLRMLVDNNPKIPSRIAALIEGTGEDPSPVLCEMAKGLQAQGAEVFSLPSAFTAPTGRAHWELLVRARAVENLCYVLAPAQSGTHENGRETYGDSMIVDPWGHVVARVAEAGPGLAVAEIDRTLQHELRGRFPALAHRKFQVTSVTE